MKTVIRIGDVLDTPEALAERKFSAFGVKTFVDNFSKTRGDAPEALLIVEHDDRKRPVYITVGPNPPELLVGDREVHAVFAPPDSQEPCASFATKEDAVAWGERQDGGYIVRRIDSTDRLGVQPSVAVIVRRNDDVLYCRLRRGKLWTLPEGRLEVGESVEAAARRAVKQLLGLEIGDVMIPGNVPYVNTFIEQAAQHFLTCVLVANYEGGTPTVHDPHGVIEHCEWFPAKDPPGPLFPTVQGIIRILKAKETPGAPAPTKRVPDRTRPTVEHAKAAVAEATAPHHEPFLITGTPRCGTQYTVGVLQAAFAQHDTDVMHEAVGSLGCVSWHHVDPTIDRRYWSERHQLRLLVKEWSAVAHQTRHPLKVIASLPTIMDDFTANHGWQKVEQALDDHLRNHPAYRPGEDDYTWPGDLSSIEAYAAFVLRWNLLIEKSAAFRYRVEDLHGRKGSVWPSLLEHLELPTTTPFPRRRVPRDARSHDNVTWRDIKNHAPAYYDPLRDMATRYGYL